MARNYRDEYDKYQGTPEQRRKNDMRKAARRKMVKLGKAKPGDGKDVNHVKPLAKGGSNDAANLKMTTRKKNRSFARTKNAGMK